MRRRHKAARSCDNQLSFVTDTPSVASAAWQHRSLEVERGKMGAGRGLNARAALLLAGVAVAGAGFCDTFQDEEG